MIEVHKIASKENEIIMQMTEKDNILCLAYAKIDGNIATLEYIDEKVPNVAYSMGKSILNAIDLRGIQEVKCENKKLENILKNLGFKLQNDVYLLDLKNYFTTDCKKDTF